MSRPTALLPAAVRLETARLTTLRSSALLLLAAASVGALGAAALAALSTRTELGRGGLVEALTAGSAAGVSVTGVLAALAGALVAAGDHRHGAARAALAVVPHRGALLAARTLVVALWSALLAGASVAAATATALLWPGQELVSASPRPVVIAVPLLGFVALVVLHGLVGMALAGLLRSALAAVAVVAAWPLLLEPLLGLALPRAGWGDALQSLLPGASAARLVSLPPVGSGTAGALQTLEAGAALGVVVLVVGALAAARFARRDA